MAGSTFGKLFCVTTFGESHGKAVGAVIDGCPAGLPLSEADIQPFLDRRRPGNARYTSTRAEGDKAEILSGIYEGKTTGTPIAVLIRNEDQRSQDYNDLADVYRPGHADFSFDQKFGFRDWRGGGRSSGRETTARVIGGAIASRLLSTLGITIQAQILSIGGAAPELAQEKLKEAAAHKDSLGGIIECTVQGVPAGLGDPVFEKLDAALAGAILSIGASKGVEFGDGFAASSSCGSKNNDPFRIIDGKIRLKTNHSGGILGGISTGEEIVLRAAFKPTSSIATKQETVTKEGVETTLVVKGRHDTCIVPRAVVVVESMTALVLTDALLKNMTSRMDSILKVYGK